MIGIVVAMEKEANCLFPLIKNLKEQNLAGKKMFLGKLFNKEIAMIISGIGKVSSALSTQALIDKYDLEYIFNFGSAGAVNKNLTICNYYLIEKCMQFDFDLREIDDVPLGYIQDYNKVFFETTPLDTNLFDKITLATADKFTSKKETIDEIIKIGIDIRDMEGCAIAQVCTSNNVKLIMLKGVSDVYGSGNDGQQFIQNLGRLSQGFPEAINKIFQLL